MGDVADLLLLPICYHVNKGAADMLAFDCAPPVSTLPLGISGGCLGCCMYSAVELALQ